jgi:hypothetical protein
MTTNAIAPPADARRVFPWEFDGAGWARWFDGTARSVGPAAVTVTGRQFDDGTVLRGVTLVLGDDELLDGDEARAIATVLLEAADELERPK